MENNQTEEAHRAGHRIQGPKDPLGKYNLIMKCYNCPYHLVGEVRLTVLPHPQFYQVFFRFTRLPYFLVLFLGYVLPYFNFVALAVVAMLWLLFERSYKVAEKNKGLVANPLLKMVRSGDVCRLFQVSNIFLKLPREQIPAALDLTYRRVAENKYIVMFYNEAFLSWYRDFRLWRYHHLFHVLLGIVTLAVIYLLVYPALGFDPLLVIQLPE